MQNDIDGVDKDYEYEVHDLGNDDGEEDDNQLKSDKNNGDDQNNDEDVKSCHLQTVTMAG